MQSLKDKLYNYEVTPPPQSWQLIGQSLDEEKNKRFSEKKWNSKLYFSLAAAVAVLVFSVIFWMRNANSKSRRLAAEKSVNNAKDGITDSANTLNDKITIPLASSGEISSKQDPTKYAGNTNEPRSNSDSKKYITIAGPQGQPVKISSKAATLIVSADHENPKKLIWSDKVNKWKRIMTTNALTPTTANFLDILELTHALKINSP